MGAPFSDSKRATTSVVVELSRSQVSPTLPLELRDHISPNTWEIRVSILARLASQYCRTTFERVCLVVILLSTFLVLITTYYVILHSLENTTTGDVYRQVWFARFSCIAVTIATWIVLSAPVVVWKYLGKVRVMRLADQWTRTDALSASSYGAGPVWKASVPWLFRDTIILTVTVPLTKKSNFDRDSCLPSYIAAGDDALPPYGDSRMTHWSKDLNGGIRYGDLPIYTGES